MEKKPKMKKIGVIFGGMSTEHTQSINSGLSVVKFLDRDKYIVTPLYINSEGIWYIYIKNYEEIKILNFGEDLEKEDLKKIDNLFEKLKSFDILFPVLHGLFGEDGSIQGLFEMLKIPYVGCRILSSCLGMDKVYSKIIFDKAKINQAKSIYIKKIDDSNTNYIYIDEEFNETNMNLDNLSDKIIKELNLPIIVKPSNSGSSIGIKKVNNKDELKEAIINVSKYDKKILAEKFIYGKEVTCAVFGNDEVYASCVGLIKYTGEFFDYNAKFNNSDTKHLVPAPIDENISEEIRKLAIKAYKAIDGKGFSRVDFFIENETNKIILIEINTIPGFTTRSFYRQLWEKSGKSYVELLDELINLAY